MPAGSQGLAILEAREGGDLAEALDHVLVHVHVALRLHHLPPVSRLFAAVQVLPHGGEQRGVTAQGDVVTDVL